VTFQDSNDNDTLFIVNQDFLGKIGEI